MTTTARQREVERVTTAYQVALTGLGVKTVAEAIILWESLPATAQQQQANVWLNQAVTLVMTRRSLSVQLARAYYRLVRALITGTTVSDPTRPEPATVTLADLRYQFEQLSGPESTPEPQTDQGQGQASTGPQQPAQPHENDGGAKPRQTLPDDDQLVPVEKIDTSSEEREAIRQAGEEAKLALLALGAQNQASKAAAIDTKQPAEIVDKQRQEAHEQAGARQAATASRLVMNGARSTSWLLQEKDKRALGWARVSTTGTPCGWCAMLISRGPVYASAASATQKGGGDRGSYVDGDKYHDNCYCVAIPIFSYDFYNGSPLFALNRTYSDLWPTVTKGLGGKSALSAWRRFIRTQKGQPLT